MNFEIVFRALTDETRRRITDELAERDGHTLLKLRARLDEIFPGHKTAPEDYAW